MTKSAKNNILLIWHDTSYGIGFLKNILGAFYSNRVRFTSLKKANMPQKELEQALEENRNKFPFKKIYLFHVSEEVSRKYSSTSEPWAPTRVEDDVNAGHLSSRIREKWFQVLEACKSLQSQLKYIKEKFPEDSEKMTELLWRHINHYSLEDQLYWLRKVSNFSSWNDHCEVESVDLSFGKQVTDLRNLPELVKAMNRWLLRERDNLEKGRPNIFINVSQGNKEAQICWYLLNERGFLPEKTRFFQSYVSKDKPPKPERYKNIYIKPADKDIFQKFSPPELYEKTASPKRNKVNALFETYIELGFSILLTGPRGVGKTRLVMDIKDKLNNSNKPSPVEMVSCELLNNLKYFEEEFLGKNRSAILRKADQGILLLDDLHLLYPETQLRILPFLATDEKNQLKNYDRKTSISLICASNVSIEQLRRKLLPEFFDRVVQLIIEIPPLKEVPEDREADWQRIWEQLNFKDGKEVPKEPDLMRWLRSLELPGNFRDLQRIAIAWHAWTKFPKELKDKTSLEYVQQQYQLFSREDQKQPNYPFTRRATLRKMKADFFHALASWAKDSFGSDKAASEHFQRLDPDEKITRGTLNNWRNNSPSAS